MHVANKIVFFGTSDFAVPALYKLVEHGYDIVAAVTQPDKPAGRKKILTPSPVKLAAEKLKLKIYQPEKVEIGRWKSVIPYADVYVVASYGKIIPSEIFNYPKFGTLNIHPSLLPKYRGPSPIQNTILNGDLVSGVTIIKIDEQVDHGPIIASKKLKTRGENYKQLHDILADLGAELLIEILSDYIAGKIQTSPQYDSKATFTKLFTKADSRVDWSKSAEEIERQVRAFSHWPVAWSILENKRIKIFEAKVISKENFQNHQTGSLLITENKQLLVKAKNAYVEILELQLEGSKKILAKDFLHGNPGLNGTILV